MLAYVGSRTTRERHARGEGLIVYQVDDRTGALERVQVSCPPYFVFQGSMVSIET